MTFKRTLLALLLSAPFLGAQTSNLLIENVTLIDGTGKDPRSGVSVLIQGDRIHRISGVRIDAIADMETIDGSGRFLIPGLMDMHVHLQGGRGRQGPNRDRAISRLHSFLYSGVTTIYDAGNSPDFLFGLRDEEREGTLESPRIFGTGGIVTYPGSHGASPVAILIDSWPADRELLIQHLDRAPDVLKLTYEERGWGIRPLIPLLPQELMSRIILEANLRGIRTTVHTSSELRAREAIAAGTDTLAHPVIQGPVTDDFVKLMAAKRIPMVSTLTIGEGYSRLAEQPEFLDQPLYRDTLPAAERQRLQTVESARQKENRWAAWMKIMTPVAQDNLLKVHQAGGIVVLGTDQSLGPSTHREMELLVEAGIPPLDVIRIATLHGAVFLGREKDMGSIEEGKLADMVLLEADPLADIDNAKRIHSVIKDGQIVRRRALKLPVNDR